MAFDQKEAYITAREIYYINHFRRARATFPRELPQVN